MALANEKIEGFRKDLFARREALATEMRRSTAEMIDDTMTHHDALDQASADADRTIHFQMKNRDRDILWQLDEAITRLDAGQFGVCEQCDDEISEARMKAFPFTTLCIDCKSELESEEHRFRG